VSERRPCRATNKRGEPCGNEALPGTDWCDVPGHRQKAERTELPGGGAIVAIGPPEGVAAPAGFPPAYVPSPPLPVDAAPPPPAAPPLPESLEIRADLFALPAAPIVEAEPVVTASPPEGAELPADLAALVVAGATEPEDWSTASAAEFVGDTLDAVLEACGKSKLSGDARRRLGKAWCPVLQRHLPAVGDGTITRAALQTGLEVGPKFAPELVAVGQAVVRKVTGQPAPPAPDLGATVDGEPVAAELGGPRSSFVFRRGG
jgi:hypothetical protein